MERLLLLFGAIAAFFTLRSQSNELAEKTDSVIERQTDPITRQEKEITMDDIYRRHAQSVGVDWRLLKAIARVESSENPNAVNPSDPSVGLMQILCVPDGKGGCANKFNIAGWPPKNREELFNPDFNVLLGAQILAWNIQTFGTSKGIAVYNSWSARNDPRNGPFRNQSYVDKVMAEYRALGGFPSLPRVFPGGIGA